MVLSQILTMVFSRQMVSILRSFVLRCHSAKQGQQTPPHSRRDSEEHTSASREKISPTWRILHTFPLHSLHIHDNLHITLMPAYLQNTCPVLLLSNPSDSLSSTRHPWGVVRPPTFRQPRMRTLQPLGHISLPSAWFF